MFRTLRFDRRLHAWIFQALLALAAVGGVAWLVANAMRNLARRGIMGGFDFLDQAARFPISESLLAYETTDTFARAFAVGITNTIFVSALVIALSTPLGFGLALMRRSLHPIVSGASSACVEVLRNTPLVVQLLFWYGLVTVNLPGASQALSPLPGVFLSIRGLVMPRLALTGDVSWLVAAAVLGLALVVAGAAMRRPLRRRLAGWPVVWSAVALAAIALAVAVRVGGVAGTWDVPALQGLNFNGGTTFTPEFIALVVGLVVYSTAFTSEIVRGGIDSVSAGQWHAGASLGLRRWQVLRLVVLPQALRVIVPPMTSQYLAVVKNSTLALAVGYPDLSFVVATTINQTGQAVEGILILMGVFLAISLSVSLFMNWYNRRAMRWGH